MTESGAAAKLCDSCGASRALQYCRADSAFLCGGCDARVHGANGLSSRHSRSWLCEVCEHAPATVTCNADAASLCAACDADIHSANPLARRHERLPLLPFLGPAPLPTAGRVRSAASSLRPSVEDEEAPVLRSAEEFFFTDADAFLDLDYEIKNATEAGSSILLSPDGGYFDLNVAGAKPEPDASFCLSESSEVAVVPDISKTLPMAGIPCDPAAARAEREARLVRYREKRKNRRFEKTIRYATRKAYAEARPRMKGRFMKRAEVETEVDRINSSAAEAEAVAALMAEEDCGVVPLY